MLLHRMTKPWTYVLSRNAIGELIVIPDEYSLRQNYPIPFNPSTMIEFDIPSDDFGLGYVETHLVIYDILGREVDILVNKPLTPGKYSIAWQGKDKFGMNVASGIYFYHLDVGKFRNVKKMLLVR